MPRPEIVFDENQKQQIQKLAGYGLTLDEIADTIGVSLRTLNNKLKNFKDINALYKKGRTEAKVLVTKSLFSKIKNGDTACILFYLKCQCGWKETQTLEFGQNEIKVKITINDPNGIIS